MIREHMHHGVQFDYVNGDGLYGNGFEFSKGLASLGVKYILETHCDQLIFTQEPRIAVPDAEPGKRGRKPRAVPEVLRPISPVKRGRKPKIQQNYSPLVTMIEDMTAPRKRPPRQNKFADVKIKVEKKPVVELPVTEEVNPLGVKGE